MKEFFKHTIYVIAFLVFFSSCGDDAEESNAQSAREKQIELLAGTEGKSWTLESASSGFLDITQFLPACDKDNLYVLYPTGEGEYRSGEEKCQAGEDEVIDAGEWELSEDLKTLSLTIGLLQNDSEILELNEDILLLRITYQDQNVVATFVPAE